MSTLTIHRYIGVTGDGHLTNTYCEKEHFAYLEECREQEGWEVENKGCWTVTTNPDGKRIEWRMISVALEVNNW